MAVFSFVIITLTSVQWQSPILILIEIGGNWVTATRKKNTALEFWEITIIISGGCIKCVFGGTASPLSDLLLDPVVEAGEAHKDVRVAGSAGANHEVGQTD